MGHSGVLLAVYLAIGPAATDEEQAKTFLLMSMSVCPGVTDFEGHGNKKDASNASRKSIYYGRLESKPRIFDFRCFP